MQALSFIVDGEFFAIDVSLVQTVVRKIPITPVPTAPGEIVGIANFKGRVISVLCLQAYLERTDALQRGRGFESFSTVIFKPISGDEDQLGLAIDEAGDLINIDESDAKPYVHPTQSKGHSCISSIVEIEGTLYRIVDLHQISDGYKTKKEHAHSKNKANADKEKNGNNTENIETGD
ncbi:MAG: chemotaxis protein CheW [Oscillospiraceae bacterium]|nr:chemotaxis protein CheW [Oscillospiraceae bacterium]